MNTDTAEAAALATLNKAAEQVYNLEGDQWQEAYETIEAIIDKLNHQLTNASPTLRCVVVEHNLVVTATGEKLAAKVCEGGLWGDDFDNLASSNPEDPFIYKDVEGRTLPPEPYGRLVTFTQVFLRTTKTNEQLLQEYK